MLGDYATLDPLQVRIAVHRRYSRPAEDADPDLAVDRAVALTPDAELLDVGCGTGWYLRNLVRSGHRGRLIGIDTSRAAIDALRGVAGVGGLLSRAEELPFRDATFDTVTARHMLYHVPDPVAAITAAHRVLRSGGAFSAVVNIVDATPVLLGLTAGAVAEHGLPVDRCRIPVDSANLPGLVERVFGSATVDRYDGALVFDAPEPMIAYATSCLVGYGVPADHPLRPDIVDSIGARARALFVDRPTVRDPKGYVVVTARRP